MAHRTFGTWLKQFKDDGGPIADLANDMLWDCEDLGVTPRYFKTPQTLYSRLIQCDACPEAIEILIKAAEMFGQPIERDEDEDDY
jgi:hypothetical protein